jgi:hypothetical protein
MGITLQPAWLLGWLGLSTKAVDNLVNRFPMSLSNAQPMRACYRSDIFYPASKSVLNQQLEFCKEFFKKLMPTSELSQAKCA